MQLMKGRSYYALSRTSRLRRYTNTSTDQVGTYQQQLVNIIDDLDDTEAEMEQALQAVQEKWANIAADVQELAITPYKKDIHVELFGLGWVPYWDVIINGQTVVLPATEIGSRG
jgi:hypoxanthine phosphoribosyltransferase